MKNKLPIVYFKWRDQWLLAVINLYLVIGVFGITRCLPLPRCPLCFSNVQLAERSSEILLFFCRYLLLVANIACLELVQALIVCHAVVLLALRPSAQFSLVLRDAHFCK